MTLNVSTFQALIKDLGLSTPIDEVTFQASQLRRLYEEIREEERKIQTVYIDALRAELSVVEQSAKERNNDLDKIIGVLSRERDHYREKSDALKAENTTLNKMWWDRCEERMK